MRFYLGNHRPQDLERTAVPLFISHRRLSTRKRLPIAQGPWSLDSGGFSELSLFGEWRTTPIQYVKEVKRYIDEVGQLEWASIQDWMCEPFLLAKTGLTVSDHQRHTIESYLTLQDLDPHLPWTPVLQGWEPSDYLRHIDQYAKAGIDLTTIPIVGVGSVCRRQHSEEIASLIREFSTAGIRLHGFGVKMKGLERIAGLLTSADSMAWSFQARKIGHPMYKECTHRNCANCLRFALAWREKVLAIIGRSVTLDD